MKILIGCEESQTLCGEFRRQGFDAYSTDLLPTRGNADWHFQGCVKKTIQKQQWDMIIIHPPCTALSLSGNRWYGSGMEKHQDRVNSIKWTTDLWELTKKHSRMCALENPASVIFKYITEPVTWVQPWEHGHGEVKKTGFALHNLNPIKPTNIVEGRNPAVWLMAPSPTRARDRSKTYDGIARAIVNQWGPLLTAPTQQQNQMELL